MAKIFIANVSLQNQLFQFRMPGERSLRSQHIAVREQVQLSGEFQPEDVAALVEQHEPYGLVAATRVGQARRHITLLYNVGAQVTVAQQKQALERNIQVADERGRENRAAVASAVASTMETYRPDKFRGAEVQITEVRKDMDAPLIDEHHVRSEHNRAGFIERSIGGNVVAPPVSRRRRPSKELQ